MATLTYLLTYLLTFAVCQDLVSNHEEVALVGETLVLVSQVLGLQVSAVEVVVA